MEVLELMKDRHSVRQYKSQKIEAEKRAVLETLAKECNFESGLNIQLIYDEPKCFNSMMAHYGKFNGVTNYIAVVGKKGELLDEKAGFYGEKLVLKAQEIGLNTCWVAMTHGKTTAKIDKGEKLAIVIALGYGENQGIEHTAKKISDVCDMEGTMPEWFEKGMEAALLAPTAMNQQKFKFSLKEDKVLAVSTGGFYSKIDLGIVEYHFEVVSGHKVQ